MKSRNVRELSILLVFVFVAGVFVVLDPFTGVNHTSARKAGCLSNLKQAMLGNIMYAYEHDDRIPICTSWMDSTSGYAKNEDIFRCPQIKNRKKDEYGHAMNVAVSGIDWDKVKKPDSVVCLFDSILLDRNACSGFYGFPNPKVRRTNIGYLDGHARALVK